MAANFPFPEKRTAWCNRCRGETHHSYRHVVPRLSEAGEYPAWTADHAMLECLGCNSITFRIRYMEEDQIIDDGEGNGVPEVVEEYFPPRVSRPKPTWLPGVEWSIQEVMEEVYTALHSNLRNLAGMGVRTVIDRIMTDKVGASGTFVTRLDRMVDQHLITGDQKTILDTALDVGHATNHRGMRPSARQLTTVMDIIENLLQTLYILPEQAAQLRQRIPPRL